MHVPDRIAYDGAAGLAPAADGAPSAGKYEGNVDTHRSRNAPAGGSQGIVPFKNLKSGKE